MVLCVAFAVRDAGFFAADAGAWNAPACGQPKACVEAHVSCLTTRQAARAVSVV